MMLILSAVRYLVSPNIYFNPSLQSSNIASIKLPVPCSAVQMPVTFKSALLSNARHCASVRSALAASAIMKKSNAVVFQLAPTSGTMFSLIKIFE